MTSLIARLRAIKESVEREKEQELLNSASQNDQEPLSSPIKPSVSGSVFQNSPVPSLSEADTSKSIRSNTYDNSVAKKVQLHPHRIKKTSRSKLVWARCRFFKGQQAYFCARICRVEEGATAFIPTDKWPIPTGEVLIEYLCMIDSIYQFDVVEASSLIPYYKSVVKKVNKTGASNHKKDSHQDRYDRSDDNNYEYCSDDHRNPDRKDAGKQKLIGLVNQEEASAPQAASKTTSDIEDDKSKWHPESMESIRLSLKRRGLLKANADEIYDTMSRVAAEYLNKAEDDLDPVPVDDPIELREEATLSGSSSDCESESPERLNLRDVIRQQREDSKKSATSSKAIVTLQAGDFIVYFQPIMKKNIQVQITNIPKNPTIRSISLSNQERLVFSENYGCDIQKLDVDSDGKPVEGSGRWMRVEDCVLKPSSLSGKRANANKTVKVIANKGNKKAPSITSTKSTETTSEDVKKEFKSIKPATKPLTESKAVNTKKVQKEDKLTKSVQKDVEEKTIESNRRQSKRRNSSKTDNKKDDFSTKSNREDVAVAVEEPKNQEETKSTLPEKSKERNLKRKSFHERRKFSNKKRKEESSHDDTAACKQSGSSDPDYWRVVV